MCIEANEIYYLVLNVIVEKKEISVKIKTPVYKHSYLTHVTKNLTISVKGKRTVSKWNKVSEVGNRNNWRGRIRNTTIRNQFHCRNPSCLWWRQKYCHDLALGMDNVKETKWKYIQKEEEGNEYKERSWGSILRI